MSMFPTGRTVLITGASSGIGLELARLFAENGDSLILAARREDRLNALAEELRAKHHGRIEVIPSDLSKPEGPKALVIEAGRRGLIIDVLVNNAGFGLRGRFAKLPFDRQMEMVQVNMAAPTALASLLLRGMLARGKGGILNVASLAAFQPGPDMAVYYATKAYLLSFSEALFEETRKKGVTVTALCPGHVPTEFGAVSGLTTPKGFEAAVVSAPDVAKAGFDGFQAGKAIVIPGALPKLGAFATRFFSRGLVRRVAHELQRVKG